MPARLRILLTVFGLFALTNLVNGASIAYRHSMTSWPARLVLSVAVSCAYLTCGYLIWKKKKEAKWLTTIFIAVLMLMIFGPDLYRFGVGVSQRSADTRFAPDIQIEWVRALVYVTFVVIVPGFVYWLISSPKSKTWLTS